MHFEKEKLLDPLGMTDTSFFVTDPAKFKLIAQPMPNDSDFRAGFEQQPGRRQEMGIRRRRHGLHHGGSRAVFADAAQRRQPRRQAISQPEGVRTDGVGSRRTGLGRLPRDYFYFPGDGFGFGLGFGVRTDPGNAKPPPPGSLGELKWDGASGCYFVIDRKQDMFFVLLEQTPSERQRIQTAVKKMIYEAMEN